MNVLKYCRECEKPLRQKFRASVGVCLQCERRLRRVLPRLREAAERKQAAKVPTMFVPPVPKRAFNGLVFEPKVEPGTVRMLHLRAYGFLPERRAGLGWVRVDAPLRCLVQTSSREWKRETVALVIERFMRAVRGTWPDWLPPQEPVVEVFDWYL